LNAKKILQGLLVILLLMFSFYYTNKSIELIRETDPIMKQIKTTDSKYNLEAENAKIIDDKIIPGKSGKQIDYEKSYSKMKQYGGYNESLTVFKEVSPAISIEDYYDKYIIKGNKEEKAVALVFKVLPNSSIDKIVNILTNKKVRATFFLDGLYIENNTQLVQTLNQFELELLSYDQKYEEVYFNSSLNYLNSLTKKEGKYCYGDYDQKEIIELCSKLNLHTVLPTIKIGNFPYNEIKTKLENSAIISFPINSSTEIELSTVIDYIIQKGYSFLTLDSLLQESYEK